ncbi:MAG TPA: tail fiber protein [Acidobacteriaceae bacterium]|nr:tail fiber protein [Acidobacteriaceae bacterium]
MSDQYLGEIRMTGFNFAPVGWALCQGQTLSIAQYSALFALLGTTYGGNGSTNFNLPDLQGRVPISWGSGVGLSPVDIGEKAGSNNVQIALANLPSHNHPLNVSNGTGVASDPTGAFLAQPNTSTDPRTQGTTTAGYLTGSPTGQAAPGAIGNTGGSLPLSVAPPYLVVNFIIALTGIFPSRN